MGHCTNCVKRCDVCFSDDFVRFTSESGHSRQARQCPLIAEAVEKLVWGLPNERLIRDTALRGKNDSLRSRNRFFHCAKAVAGRVLQQPWLLTDMNGHSDYVRCTPETGHAISDVRLTPNFVRFTPVNGHYSGTPICPFLTLSGHYEPR